MTLTAASLKVTVGADLSGLTTGLKSASDQLKGFSSTANTEGKKADGFLGSIGSGLATGAGIVAAQAGFQGITGAITDLVGAGPAYQTMMQNIQGNTTLTTAQTNAMSDAIKSMAADSSAPLDQLAQGYMHISNLGYQGADATKILQAAMESAVSSGSNVSDVANVLGSDMKEFGLQGGDAAKAMDVLHLAAAQGNMTLEQLVENAGKATSTAANLGDTLPDVSAALSALTRHGFDAAQAGTQVTGMLTHIVNPSASATAELQKLSDTTGIDLVGDFSQAGLKAKGLSGIMADVQKATKGDSSEILKLIPALRGGQGALALTGSGAADFTSILGSLNDTMAGKSTPTLTAYQEKQKTVAFQFGELKNQAQLAVISLSSALLPALLAGAKGLEALVTDARPVVEKYWPELQQGAKDIGHWVGDVAAPALASFFAGDVLPKLQMFGGFLKTDVVPAVEVFAKDIAGPAFEGFKGFIQFVSDHKEILGALAIGIGTVATAMGIYSAATTIAAIATGALDLALSPVIIPILALSVAAFGVIEAVKHWSDIKAIAGDVFGAVKGFAGDVLDFFKQHWPEIATLLAGPFAPLVALATDGFGIRTKLLGAFQGIIADAKGIASGFGDAIKSVFDAGVGKLGDFKDALGTFFTKTLPTFFTSTVPQALSTLPGLLLDGLKAAAFAAGVAVATIFIVIPIELGKAAIAGIKALSDGLGAAADAVSKALGAAWDWISGTDGPKSWPGRIVGFFASLGGDFKAQLVNQWDTAKTALTDAWGWLSGDDGPKGWPAKIVSFFGSLGGDFKAALASQWTTAKEALIDAWTWLSGDDGPEGWPGKIVGFFSTLGADFKDALSGAWTTAQGALTGAWSWISDKALGVASWPGGIVAFFGSLGGDFKGALAGAWTIAQGAFTEAWNWISGSDGPKSWPSKIVGFFGSLGDDLKKAIGAGLSGFTDAIAGPLNAGISIVNSFISGINSITGQFKIPAIPSIPKINAPAAAPGGAGNFVPAFAAGGSVERTQLAMVGERGPEMVVLPAGASVIPNHMLRANGVPGFAGGTSDAGDILGGLVSGAGSVLGDLSDAAKSLLAKGADAVLGAIPIPKIGTEGLIGDILRGSVTMIKDAAWDFIKSLFGQASAAVSAAGASAIPAGQYVPSPPTDILAAFKAAMSITGVPGSWLPGLEIIGYYESVPHWNPGSINDWDINAINHDPSEGLMQTTLSTFAANMLPGHGNIFDPTDNIIAAIRYIEGRYHSIDAVPGVASIVAGGPYLPYADGGWITEPSVGIGLRTGRRFTIAEHEAEHVTPASKMGGGRTENHYHFAPGSVVIPARDLKEMQDVTDFFRRLPQVARATGVR